MELRRFIVIDCNELLFSASTKERCRQFVKHPENYRTQYANGIIEVGATPFIVDTWKEGINLDLTDSKGNIYHIYTRYGVFDGASKDAKRVNINPVIKGKVYHNLAAARRFFEAQKGTQSGWVNKYYACELAYEVVYEDSKGIYTITVGMLDSFTESLEWQGTSKGYCSPKTDLIDVLVDGEERSVSPSTKGEQIREFIYEYNGDIYRIAEGSGDALFGEDIEDGYIDYIYYDILEDATDEDSVIDGGCILLKKNYVDLTIKEIIQKVLDFNYWSPESNYTQSYREEA